MPLPSYLACIAFILTATLSAQYAPPLRTPLLVTGTFGELRSNHFHAGLDFRGATGTPVYAVNDGFVSRIKISGGGYGQAIYIDHPDGKRSVYGHLETLAPQLLDTVRSVQYARESFAVDLRFDSLALPVSRGELIGEIGNRGHSFGSHLHFEMRETGGDAPLNPLAFGFDVADTRSPQIRNLRVYGLDASGHEISTLTLEPREGNGGQYQLSDTLVVSDSRIAFGLKAYDRQNAMPNWNGVYAGKLLRDSTVLFSFAFDRIPFEDTEYLNALTDYRDWKENSSWYHLFWARTRDAMFWNKAAKSKSLDGTVTLRPEQPLQLRLEVSDYADNTSTLPVTVVYRPGTKAEEADPEPHQYFLPRAEPSIIDNGDFRLELPLGALYTDLYFRYLSMPDESAGRLSDVHRLHDRLTPLHGGAILHLRPRQDIPENLRDKVYVGSCATNGAVSSRGGIWQDDGRMAARIGSFGDYSLMLDTIAPTIRIERFATDQRRSGGFSLLIADESGGSLDYRATVDGKWILMELDAKSNRLDYTFKNGDFAPGEHEFKLELTDGRGNRSEFRRLFRR